VEVEQIMLVEEVELVVIENHQALLLDVIHQVH
jgi:hypothetical protein